MGVNYCVRKAAYGACNFPGCTFSHEGGLTMSQAEKNAVKKVLSTNLSKRAQSQGRQFHAKAMAAKAAEASAMPAEAGKGGGKKGGGGRGGAKGGGKAGSRSQSPTRRANRNGEVNCFNCGSPDHWARDCDQPPAADG